MNRPTHSLPGCVKVWRSVWIPGFAGLLLAQACLGNPARDPKRLVNSHTVDLSPLFKWWQRKDGPRPLSAWTHLTGTIVGTNSGAWIIEGKIDGAKTDQNPTEAKGAGGEPTRFLILNPPLEDYLEFQRLVSRSAELSRREAGLASEAAQAHSRDSAVTEQERALRRNRNEARLLAAEDKVLKGRENQAKLDQKAVERELNDVKSKLGSYPKPSEYVLDCFVLDMHSEYQHLPIYDYGRVWK